MEEGERRPPIQIKEHGPSSDTKIHRCFSRLKDNMKTITKIQAAVAIAAFFAAVGFGIAGFTTPPPGQIHDSVLYLIAQFLLLTASIFGVGAMFANNKLNSHVNEQHKSASE